MARKIRHQFGRIKLPGGTTQNERAKARVQFKPAAASILLTDEQTEMLDRALTAAERELLPLLVKKSASEVQELFQTHIQIHFGIELQYIKTGNGDDFEGKSIKHLRHEYVQLKRHPFVQHGLCPVCKHNGEDCTGNKNFPYEMAHF